MPIKEILIRKIIICKKDNEINFWTNLTVLLEAKSSNMKIFTTLDNALQSVNCYIHFFRNSQNNI